MKSRIAIALSFITILAVPFAYGQSVRTLGKVDIPFKFMVAKKEMPAGKYEVTTIQGEAEGRESRLLLRNWQSKASVFVPIIERLAETNPAQKHEPRIVFDTIKDQHFLSEFWPADNADGYLLGINKGEEKHQIVEEK
jgi:hypothetical protein